MGRAGGVGPGQLRDLGLSPPRDIARVHAIDAKFHSRCARSSNASPPSACWSTKKGPVGLVEIMTQNRTRDSAQRLKVLCATLGGLPPSVAPREDGIRVDDNPKLGSPCDARRSCPRITEAHGDRRHGELPSGALDTESIAGRLRVGRRQVRMNHVQTWQRGGLHFRRMLSVIAEKASIPVVPRPLVGSDPNSRCGMTSRS